jgi:hypothetical protein
MLSVPVNACRGIAWGPEWSPTKHIIQIARIEHNLALLEHWARAPLLHRSFLLGKLRLSSTLQADYGGRVFQSMGDIRRFHTYAYLEKRTTIEVFVGWFDFVADVIRYQAIPW